MYPLPSITVVVPAHNAAGFFESAMRTIGAQEYPNLVVSIVDDGSEDSLAELAAREERLRVLYVRQERRGPAAARNVAIRGSSSDFIAFLDIDDLWTPGHLHRLCAILAANPHAGVAQGETRNFICDEDGVSRWCSAQYACFNFGACIYRRGVFEECGLFDEDLRFGEDFDMAMRCFERGLNKVATGELSLLYRRHDCNMTRGKDLKGLGLAHVYKKRLDRVRRGLFDPAAAGTDSMNQYLGLPPSRFVGAREPLDQCELLAACGTPAGPKVSVVMLAYKGLQYLDQSLQSVLGEPYRPLEVLVVDDGSESPGVREVAKAFGPAVRVVHRPQLGAAAAGNTCIAEASGEYMAFLDSGDLWPLDKLRSQVAYLESHPNVDLALGRIPDFLSPELTEEEKGEIHSPLESVEGWRQCAMLVRRSSLQRIGPFNDQLFTADFAEWLTRASDMNLQVAHLPQDHLFHRLRRNNTGRVNPSISGGFAT